MAITERTTGRWPDSSASTVTDGPRPTTTAAATVSVGVGTVHLVLAPEHLQHWWVFGAFFLAVGLFQLGYATAVLWRPTRQVALTGIVVNVVVVLTYVASRTAGLPLEPPDRGSPAAAGIGDGHGEGASVAGVGYTEAVGPVDLATTAAELVLIALLVSLLPVRLRTPTCNGLLLVGVALWGLRISGALV
jgi:hypothetical protein